MIKQIPRFTTVNENGTRYTARVLEETLMRRDGTIMLKVAFNNKICWLEK